MHLPSTAEPHTVGGNQQPFRGRVTVEVEPGPHVIGGGSLCIRL